MNSAIKANRWVAEIAVHRNRNLVWYTPHSNTRSGVESHRNDMHCKWSTEKKCVLIVIEPECGCMCGTFVWGTQNGHQIIFWDITQFSQDQKPFSETQNHFLRHQIIIWEYTNYYKYHDYHYQSEPRLAQQRKHSLTCEIIYKPSTHFDAFMESRIHDCSKWYASTVRIDKHPDCVKKIPLKPCWLLDCLFFLP